MKVPKSHFILIQRIGRKTWEKALAQPLDNLSYERGGRLDDLIRIELLRPQ